MKRIYNIEWDTDCEEIDGLPTEVEIEKDIPNDDIADYLSDNYGFCVYNFELEEA